MVNSTPPPFRVFKVPENGTSKWLIVETGTFPDQWLAFFDPSTSERRRLTPVPPGWQTFDAGALAQLLANARPVMMPRVRTAAPSSNHGDQTFQLREELEMERERRLAAEALLTEANAALEALVQELDSTNAELRALNEELQELVRERD
jgi:hypothetical protein